MLEGRLPRQELTERGIYATRQLAKRQLTWLRGMEGIESHDPLASNDDTPIRQRIEAFLQKF